MRDRLMERSPRLRPKSPSAVRYPDNQSAPWRRLTPPRRDFVIGAGRLLGAHPLLVVYLALPFPPYSVVNCRQVPLSFDASTLNLFQSGNVFAIDMFHYTCSSQCYLEMVMRPPDAVLVPIWQYGSLSPAKFRFWGQPFLPPFAVCGDPGHG